MHAPIMPPGPADSFARLTSQQQDVVVRLSAGETITAAAQALGIHRTTIHHWRRTDPHFALALADAQADHASHCQQQLASRTDAALQALDHLLTDERTPATMRIKAVQLVLSASLQPQPLNPPKEDNRRLRNLGQGDQLLALYQQAQALEQKMTGTQPRAVAAPLPVHHSSTSVAKSAAD